MKLPRARRDKLVIENLPEETLIYDLERDKAHCLNRTATWVWQHCDGRTTVRQLSARLRQELHPQAEEELIFLALEKLRKARLVEDTTMRIGAEFQSRRQLTRRIAVIGGLSLLLPAVVSIVAPTAVAAASCTTAAGCLADPRNINLCCCDVSPRKTCRTNGKCTGNAC
ncbi:MAG TPA: PqqD family protein [Acidobacteriota bacterium]